MKYLRIMAFPKREIRTSILYDMSQIFKTDQVWCYLMLIKIMCIFMTKPVVWSFKPAIKVYLKLIIFRGIIFSKVPFPEYKT